MKKKAAKRVKKTAPKKAARTTTKPAQTKGKTKSVRKSPKARAGKAVKPPALEKLAEVPAATDEGIRSLPPRQRQFVAEFVANGFNGTAAAVTVGFSKRTAASQASRLLRNVKISAAIADITGKQLAKREITAERVLDEIAKLAFFDPRKLFRADGSLIPVLYLDNETAAAIAGYKSGVSGPEVKIADKGANLERLGRWLKLFTDKVEHTGKVTLETLVLGGEG